MENEITVAKVEECCTFIASTEDDRDNYFQQRIFTPDDFKSVSLFGDIIIYQNSENYFIINDCGVCSLYKIKPNVSVI